MSYWSKKAANWVTVTVLAGGMASALILFVVAKVERDINENTFSEEQLLSLIEERDVR